MQKPGAATGQGALGSGFIRPLSHQARAVAETADSEMIVIHLDDKPRFERDPRR
jgi:hypothetical protein